MTRFVLPLLLVNAAAHAADPADLIVHNAHVVTVGANDDIGATDRVHVHDFHATILHLLGLDHTKLTYRHAGRDVRLTDVHGEVVKKILT